MKRIRPHQLVLGIWVAIAVAFGSSGVISTITQQHDDSPITRQVFQNIPGAFKLALYTLSVVTLTYVGVLFSNRVRNWERGAPERRPTTTANVKRRLRDFRAGVYMQTLLRDPAAGIMHSLIYFSFLVLFAVTSTLEVNHQLPESAKFLHGDVYRGYSAVGDTAGVLFVLGVGWALFRRYVQRPYRIRIKTKAEHGVILGVFFVLGVSGFLAEGFRIAISGTPEFERWSYVGYPLAQLVDGWSNLHGWHQAMWALHVGSFFAFLVILPTTMLRHMFTSPLNMYLRDRERPKGA